MDVASIITRRHNLTPNWLLSSFSPLFYIPYHSLQELFCSLESKALILTGCVLFSNGHQLEKKSFIDEG